MNKRWTALVQTLTTRGYESRYLDRLRRTVDVEQACADLETEIVRETAAALGRTAEKVDYALLRLELAADAVGQAGSAAERRRAVERFNDARAQALAARHELIIHREAAGFRSNDVVEKLYPIPPRRIR